MFIAEMPYDFYNPIYVQYITEYESGDLICMVKIDMSQMRHLMWTYGLVTVSCVHLSTRSQAVTFSY